METIFGEIGLVIITASILGLITRLFKQPLILAYIFAGILIGPVLGFITNQEAINILAHFGVAFLLFLVGLELNINKLKNLGLVTFLIILGQVLFSFLTFFYISRLLGFEITQSIIWGLGLTLSSTVIVIKYLSEKNDLHSLSGRILIGILLFQDVIAIFGIIALNTLNAGGLGSPDLWLNLTNTLIKGTVFLVSTLLFAKYIIPQTFRFIGKSQELLFLSAISWCFALALLSKLCGFSIEIGAFIAGITLAPLPINLAIISKIKPLRDFFITIFFVTLGMQVVFTGFSTNNILTLIVLTLAVLIIKPLIILILMGLAGFKSRTNFKVGVGLAQVSEFSFIAFALAKNYNLISATDLSIIITLGVVSIGVSTYLISNSETIFQFLKPYIKIFELSKVRREDIIHKPENLKDHIIVFGCKRTGARILKAVQKLDKQVLVVDYDPEIIYKLKQQNIACIFGDIADVELLNRVNLKQANMIISTVDSEDSNYLMLDTVKQQNSKALVYVIAHDLNTAVELYKRGAHHVIIPRMLGGEWLAEQLKHTNGNIEKLHKHKQDIRSKHLKEIKELIEKGL